jgi:hypothetical protein
MYVRWPESESTVFFCKRNVHNLFESCVKFEERAQTNILGKKPNCRAEMEENEF